VLRLLPVDYDCLPCTLPMRGELGKCYASVTVCNIESQNESNISYCMHSINPLFSIVISTTITVTTITITSIGYFTVQLFFHERYVTPPYQWNPIHCYQLATSLPPAKPLSPRPAKPDPPLPACSQRSQRSTAPSEATFTPTSEARSTATSLLPAKPNPPLTACSQRSQIVREVRVSIPPLPACSQRSQIHCYQRSQIVREVRVIIPPLPAFSQRSQIHCYQLAPSEARLSERWEWACQSTETKHIGGCKVNLSELCEPADQWWKWACQSWSGREYVRVVRLSMSVVGVRLLQSWESECTLVRVYACQSVCLSESTLIRVVNK